jgi:hypothetical protein
MPEGPTQSERFPGCLLGLMLGDCLGFSFDGSPTADTAVHDTVAQVESPVFLVPGCISRGADPVFGFGDCFDDPGRQVSVLARLRQMLFGATDQVAHALWMV